MAAHMRDVLEKSEQIERNAADDEENIRKSLIKLAKKMDINLTDECPIEPAPAQSPQLKLWFNNIWKYINCSGQQGGKKTIKYKKYRNKSKKYNKIFKKSRKYRKKKYNKIFKKSRKYKKYTKQN